MFRAGVRSGRSRVASAYGGPTNLQENRWNHSGNALAALLEHTATRADRQVGRAESETDNLAAMANDAPPPCISIETFVT